MSSFEVCFLFIFGAILIQGFQLFLLIKFQVLSSAMYQFFSRISLEYDIYRGCIIWRPSHMLDGFHDHICSELEVLLWHDKGRNSHQWRTLLTWYDKRYLFVEKFFPEDLFSISKTFLKYFMHFFLIEIVFNHLSNDNIYSLDIILSQFQSKIMNKIIIGNLFDKHFDQFWISFFIDDNFKSITSLIVKNFIFSYIFF